MRFPPGRLLHPGGRQRPQIPAAAGTLSAAGLEYRRLSGSALAAATGSQHGRGGGGAPETEPRFSTLPSRPWGLLASDRACGGREPGSHRLFFPRTVWRSRHARGLTNIGLGRADERGRRAAVCPVGTRVSISYAQLITRKRGHLQNQNV